ncbi:MAG: EAL domain-containing protein, partial [Ilumatobacter sp.]|nr:EAL domain-containing protein [Ilumatobacter sp.]
VVAEGVESTQLWDAVAHLGCDVAQGYGIAMPMSYPDLRGWLSRWNEVVVESMSQPAPATEGPLAAGHTAPDGDGASVATRHDAGQLHALATPIAADAVR